MNIKDFFNMLLNSYSKILGERIYNKEIIVYSLNNAAKLYFKDDRNYIIYAKLYYNLFINKLNK